MTEHSGRLERSLKLLRWPTLRPGFSFYLSLTEDGTQAVVREMLLMTGVRRGDEMGSRWQLGNFMDERSLAKSDGVERERRAKS